MADQRNQVRPIRKRTKAEVSGALAAGWARVSAGRKGAFADNVDIDPKTVNRTLTGETVPELHTAFNSLADDPTALDEVCALYGRRLVPDALQPGSDMELASGLGRSLSELIERIRDGHRCHLDTLALAELFRSLIPQMSAVVAEADAYRGVHG
jgi:hypothetical protein